MASAGGAEAEKAEGQKQAVRQPGAAGAEQRAAEQSSQRPGEQMIQRNRRSAEHQAAQADDPEQPQGANYGASPAFSGRHRRVPPPGQLPIPSGHSPQRTLILQSMILAGATSTSQGRR